MECLHFLVLDRMTKKRKVTCKTTDDIESIFVNNMESPLRIWLYNALDKNYGVSLFYTPSHPGENMLKPAENRQGNSTSHLLHPEMPLHLKTMHPDHSD